ncbi:50S ribosomal protein L29 [Candidatus Falkowbacteria bacterium]|nr:50S ribosomal protein L29 [Candidatus Falkowbacteria bacterium]
MKLKELKNKSGKDLRKILDESRDSLRELRFKSANDQLKNVREIRDAKKTIARIMFLLGQKDSDQAGIKAKPQEVKKAN